MSLPHNLYIQQDNSNKDTLLIKDLLLQFPSLSKTISNRDFDFYYNYKNTALIKSEPFLVLLEGFIKNLYHSGFKCKQTSVTYKFHSFPLIKIYSYLIPANNVVNYHKRVSESEMVREYKLIPNFSQLAKQKIDYYINFFIIHGKIHYGLKSIEHKENSNIINYIYGNEADAIINKVSQDKNYNYLEILKNLTLPLSFLENLRKMKVVTLSLISDEQSIIFDINSDLSLYNFYSYYNEQKIKDDITTFLM